MGQVHAALQHQILNQSANRIIGQDGHDPCPQAETTSQTAGDVVFAASFPRAKFPCRGNSNLARIETQHHFTQAE
jgi:hypothetical protein